MMRHDVRAHRPPPELNTKCHFVETQVAATRSVFKKKVIGLPVSAARDGHVIRIPSQH
jgi:hypothetical protein